MTKLSKTQQEIVDVIKNGGYVKKCANPRHFWTRKLWEKVQKLPNGKMMPMGAVKPATVDALIKKGAVIISDDELKLVGA